MEAWEKELRERLEAELPGGVYILEDHTGQRGMVGKSHMIELEVAMHREKLKNEKVKE
jgi:hypothetical protein